MYAVIYSRSFGLWVAVPHQGGEHPTWADADAVCLQFNRMAGII